MWRDKVFVSGCCWVIFGLLSFLRGFGRIAIRPYSEDFERVRNIHYDRALSTCEISTAERVSNACEIAPTAGCRTCAKYPCSEGAQRVKNASTHTSKGSLGAE